jgi:hypothetical protein
MTTDKSKTNLSMTPLFKEGDIVYFVKEYRSHYTSGYYYHKLNQPYLVIEWNIGLETQTGTIQNIEDKVKHFVHSEMRNHLIPEIEWKSINRQKNLNDLLNSDLLNSDSL